MRRKPLARYHFTETDLFCGSGGASEGSEQAEVNGEKVCRTISAVNHDPLAIATHAENHPATTHYIEDIVLLDEKRLAKSSLLWASIECTNFSNAKGGGSRNADSRTLAEELLRYAKHGQPLYMVVENVREFLAWGPLVQKVIKGVPQVNKDGSPTMVPESRKKGRDYLRWVQSIEELGYHYRYRLINSADLGARTSRLRYFGVFAKKGLPIRFPEATHSRGGKTVGTKPWLAVKPLLQLTDEGHSIFDRESNMALRPQQRKPLSPNTLKRIEYGILKYCLPEAKQFLMAYYNGSDCTKLIEKDPAGTITTKDRLAMVTPQFTTQFFGRESAVASLSDPSPAVTTVNSQQLVTVEADAEKRQFMSQHIQYTAEPNQELDRPCPTIMTRDMKQIVTVEVDKQVFLTQDMQGRVNANSIDEPIGSILTGNHKQVITTELDKQQFMTQFYTRDNANRSLDAPGPTITADPHEAMVTVDSDKNQFIAISRGQSKTRTINEPLGSISCSGGHDAVISPDIDLQQFFVHYYSGGGQTSSVDAPLPALTTVPKGRLITVLKEMGIIKDVKMRFLYPSELALIQGFPVDYKLKGSQAAQKKGIGNSVVPLVAKRVVECLYQGLEEAGLLHLLAAGMGEKVPDFEEVPQFELEKQLELF